jgi:hypothetical protein
MATKAEPRWDTGGTTRKRRRKKAPDPEQLKILRLDLHTIMEQIRLLDSEMEQDPCLSAGALGSVLAQIETFKQQLEQVRDRIRTLKASQQPCKASTAL